MNVTLGVAAVSGMGTGPRSFRADPEAHISSRETLFQTATGRQVIGSSEIQQWAWKPVGVGVDAPLPNWWDLESQHLRKLYSADALYIGCRPEGNLLNTPYFASQRPADLAIMVELAFAFSGPFKVVALDASSSHPQEFLDVARTMALAHETILSMEAFPCNADGYWCPPVPITVRFVHPVIQNVLSGGPIPRLRDADLIIVFDGKINRDVEGPLDPTTVTLLLKNLEAAGVRSTQLLMVSHTHADACCKAHALWKETHP